MGEFEPGYYVDIWCEDCYGEDPMGCFDGGTETMGPFDTQELAAACGESHVDACFLYRYDTYQVAEA